MEWSTPTQQGEIPSPRAGHAGVTVGENWFITGGGNNKSGNHLSFNILHGTTTFLISKFLFLRTVNGKQH